MGIAFSPASGSLELIEFTGTTGTTVTILYEAPTGGVEGATVSGTVTITNVVYGDTVVSTPDDLVIDFVEGESTFTFSSKFEDMFYRIIKYLVYDVDNVNLDPNYNIKTYLEAHRFKDLPELYTGIWEFVPSPIQTRSVPFLVSYNAEVTTTIPADPQTGLGGSSETINESGTATWTFMISEDPEELMKRFLEAVDGGSRYVYAKTKYPELNF